MFGRSPIRARTRCFTGMFAHPRRCFPGPQFADLSLVYTVGRYGIDDTAVSAWCSVRRRPRHVANRRSGGPRLCHRPHQYRRAPRPQLPQHRPSAPWFKALTARLHGGYLREGDTITIVFGDPAQGSPGMLKATFCRADRIQGAGRCLRRRPLRAAAGNPAIAIVPGPPHVWRAVLPSCVARVSVFTSVSNARIYGATRLGGRPVSPAKQFAGGQFAKRGGLPRRYQGDDLRGFAGGRGGPPAYPSDGRRRRSPRLGPWSFGTAR